MIFAKILSPEMNRIYQRDQSNKRKIPVIIRSFMSKGVRVQIQIDGGEFHSLEGTFIGNIFKSEIEIPVGWHTFKVKLCKGNTIKLIKKSIEFGIGDVYITAGQSNSANSGEAKLSPANPHVMAWNKKKWVRANDPQPITNGTGGTPWPPFADSLAEKYNIPIGLVSVGVGGTSVHQWLPSSNQCYGNLSIVSKYLGPNGCKALLWHQGESDAIEGTSTHDYRERLKKVIGSSRNDAGWRIPWIIAKVSCVPDIKEPEKMHNITEAQESMKESDNVFVGPTTDDLLGHEWRHDLLHFNKKGLIEHGNRWAQVVTSLYYKL